MKKIIGTKNYSFASNRFSLSINKYCLKTSVANSRGFCFIFGFSNNFKSNK